MMLSQPYDINVESDERAAVLFSPFRSKTVNEVSWNSKMNFWKDMLEKVAKEKNLITFDLNTLPQLFMRKSLTPKCLPTVVEELQREGKLKSLDEFKKSNSWLSWGFATLVKDPLSWSVTKIFGSPKKPSSVFIWPDVLKSVAKQVLMHTQSQVHLGILGHVCLYSQFQEQCLNLLSSEDHFELVLNFLQNQKLVYLKETSHGLLIKIYEKNKSSAVSPFEDIDIHIYEINQARYRLEEELNPLSLKIEGLVDEAKMCMKAKKKMMAVHCLKKKRLLEKTYIQKSSMLHNLEEILHRIDESEMNVKVVQACEAGQAVLKKMNKESNVEKVESTMDDLQEVMQDVADTSNAILAVSKDEEDADLEEELKTLLMEDNESKTDKSSDNFELPDLSKLTLSDIGLPSVPTHLPMSLPVEYSSSKEAVPL